MAAKEIPMIPTAISVEVSEKPQIVIDFREEII